MQAKPRWAGRKLGQDAGRTPETRLPVSDAIARHSASNEAAEGSDSDDYIEGDLEKEQEQLTVSDVAASLSAIQDQLAELRGLVRQANLD